MKTETDEERFETISRIKNAHPMKDIKTAEEILKMYPKKIIGTNHYSESFVLLAIKEYHEQFLLSDEEIEELANQTEISDKKSWIAGAKSIAYLAQRGQFPEAKSRIIYSKPTSSHLSK